MSFPALAFASKYRAPSSAIKLVLFAYADRHNEETGSTYPSLAWLAEFTSLNRKTIIAAVMALEGLGIMTDTGERKGHTRQIKVYRLNIETVPETVSLKSTKNGTVPKAEQYQKRYTEPSSSTSSSEPRGSSEEDVSSARDDFSSIVSEWNGMAERTGLPPVRSVSAERRKHIKARLAEHSRLHFTEAIAAVEKSSFCRGGGNTGWRADFDFLLQPKSFNRLIEGSYERSERKPNYRPSVGDLMDTIADTLEGHAGDSQDHRGPVPSFPRLIHSQSR